jgi:hypothetical protein
LITQSKIKLLSFPQLQIGRLADFRFPLFYPRWYVRTCNASLSFALFFLFFLLGQNAAFSTNFTMLSAAQHIATLLAALPGSLARQPCPTALPDSLARQPCHAALPGSLARQPCPAALPSSHAR